MAINAMVATQNYADAVRTAVEAGVDAIVSGAGLPLELPGLVEKLMLRWHPSCPADVLQSSSSAGGQKPSTAPPTSWSSRAARLVGIWLFGRRASGRKMPDPR